MPTVLRSGPYRLYFFSHDLVEPPHIHVDRDDQTAKFWLTPVSLARNLGFSAAEIRRVERRVRENRLFLLRQWNEFFDA